MVTNAVQATQKEKLDDPAGVWILGTPGYGVMLLVWDAATPQPRRPEAEALAENGRGLTIVEALSHKRGTYRPRADHPSVLIGKVVWSLLLLHAPEPTRTR